MIEDDVLKYIGTRGEIMEIFDYYVKRANAYDKLVEAMKQDLMEYCDFVDSEVFTDRLDLIYNFLDELLEVYENGSV